MIIQTNMDSKIKCHDLIHYEPIERQIYEYLYSSIILKNQDVKAYIDTEYSSGELKFNLDNYICIPIIKRNKVSLYFKPKDTDFMSDGSYAANALSFNMNLKLNTDLSKRMDKALNKIKHNDIIIQRINTIIEEFKPKVPNILIGVKKYLNAGLKGSKWEVPIFYEYDFYRILNVISNENYSRTKSILDFYISPKKEAPADGVFFGYNDDENKLVLFWENTSHPRNTLNDILRYVKYPDGITGQEEKLKDLKFIQNYIDTLDLHNCKEYMEYRDMALKVKEIYTQFNFDTV